MSYGANLTDLFRRAAGYVDRICAARSRPISGRAATKFDLVISLTAAKALGLTAPEPPGAQSNISFAAHPAHGRCCVGSRLPGRHQPTPALWLLGGRKVPRHEIAGSGAVGARWTHGDSRPTGYCLRRLERSACSDSAFCQ